MHVGAEFAGLDGFAKIGGELANELFVKGDGDGGRSGTDVGRAIAFFG